jgi:hypothetical protein
VLVIVIVLVVHAIQLIVPVLLPALIALLIKEGNAVVLVRLVLLLNKLADQLAVLLRLNAVILENVRQLRLLAKQRGKYVKIIMPVVRHIA